MNTTALKLLLLLLFCTLCRSRMCYICTTQNGDYHDRCGDNFLLTSIDAIYCAGTCLKTRGYRSVGGRRAPEVTRGCVPLQADEYCTTGSFRGISADMCYCNSDLCNRAGHLGTSIRLVVPAVTLLVYRMWKQFLL